MEVNITFKEKKMLVHQCDLCKEIVKDYTTYTLPTNEYVYLENKGIKISKFKKGIKIKAVDLCNKCSQALANFLDPYLNG